MSSHTLFRAAERAQALSARLGGGYNNTNPAAVKAQVLYWAIRSRAQRLAEVETLVAAGACPAVQRACAARWVRFGSWSWRYVDDIFQVHSNGRLRVSREIAWDHADVIRMADRQLAERWYLDLTKRRQQAAKTYADRLARAERLVLAGVVLPWQDGQLGGVFVLSDGVVSAKGLARRLGVDPPDRREVPVRTGGYGCSWPVSGKAFCIRALAHSRAAVTLEQETAPTARERAAARWARNCPKTTSRPEGKGKPWVRTQPLREALAYA